MNLLEKIKKILHSTYNNNSSSNIREAITELAEEVENLQQQKFTNGIAKYVQPDKLEDKLEDKILNQLCSLWCVGLDSSDFILVHNIDNIDDLIFGAYEKHRKYKHHIDIFESSFGEIRLVKNLLVKDGEFIIVPKNLHLKYRCPTCKQEVV
jgi:hypothetical protein